METRILPCVFTVLISIATFAGCSVDEAKPAEDLLDTCALVSSCVMGNDRLSLGETCNKLLLLDWLGEKDRSTDARLMLGMLRCLRSSRTCEDVQSCVKATPSQSEVCEGASGNRCNGNVLVECGTSSEIPDAFDCASVELVCGESGGIAGCGIAACTPESYEPHCDGDLRIYCHGDTGMQEVMDCRHSMGYSAAY